MSTKNIVSTNDWGHHFSLGETETIPAPADPVQYHMMHQEIQELHTKIKKLESVLEIDLSRVKM